MDVRVFRRTDNTFEEWRDYWDGTMKRRYSSINGERKATRKEEVGDEEG